MTNEINHESFVFYGSFYEAIKDLPVKVRDNIVKAICEYALYENEITLSDKAKPFYKLIEPQLKANIKKRKNGEKSKSNPNNGKHNSDNQDPYGVENKTPNVNATGNANGNDNPNLNNNVTATTNATGNYNGSNENKGDSSDFDKKKY